MVLRQGVKASHRRHRNRSPFRHRKLIDRETVAPEPGTFNETAIFDTEEIIDVGTGMPKNYMRTEKIVRAQFSPMNQQVTTILLVQNCCGAQLAYLIRDRKLCSP